MYANGSTSYLAFDLDGKRPPSTPITAWGQTQRLASVIDAETRITTLIEVSRSGRGWHVWILFDPEDAPSVEESRQFARPALRAAGLQDDGDEDKGHPGIYPHPPGPKGIGKAPYLPWSGLVAGATGGLFVDIADGVPIDRQETALEDVRLVTRSELLIATARLAEAAGAQAGEGPTTEPRSKASSSSRWNLDDPPWGERHGTLRDYLMHLRNLLPIEEARPLAYALAERWGMLREHRENEVENLVVGAYAKAARPVQTQADRERVVDGPAWQPSDLLGVLDQKAGEVEYLLPDLVPASALIVIAATWKSGKTLGLYRIALDATLGRPVLDYFGAPLEPVRVSLWQCEMPASEDFRRLRRLTLGSAVGIDTIPELAKDGRLSLYQRPGLDLTDAEHVARWHAEIRRTDARLVILDSLLAAACGCDLNDNGAARQLFTRAFGPLTSEGRSVVVVHHRRKAVQNGKDDDRSAVLGAQGIGAAADLVLGLERITEADGSAGAFSLRLSVTGGWRPGSEQDWIIRVADIDEGTSVRVMPEQEQVKVGGVTGPQRAAVALARLVRLRQRIARKAALAEVVETLRVSDRAAADGLSIARLKRWVDTTPSVTGKDNAIDLIPGPSEVER